MFGMNKYRGNIMMIWLSIIERNCHTIIICYIFRHLLYNVCVILTTFKKALIAVTKYFKPYAHNPNPLPRYALDG